jgi:alpha-beta hydrolase superfamily lysophospholipase
LIIDSGFADTFALLKRLGWQVRDYEDERFGFKNTEKISRILVPTLIIHGEKDSLIPLQQGEKLYNSCAAANKQLIRIKNAGHNTLFRMGMWQYFEAIQKFILGKLVLDEASLFQLILD